MRPQDRPTRGGNFQPFLVSGYVASQFAEVLSFFGQKLVKRLDAKSDLLKTTLPRIRQLCGLEEENRKLKEEIIQLKSAAQGMYPDLTASLHIFLLCVDFLFCT